MIQFKNEFVTAELANDSTAIVLTWKGFIPSANYRDALNKSLEIAKKHNIKNWVSDIRMMKVLGAKDQEWAGVDWVARAVSAGCYKKQGVIMSEDVFGQASAKNILISVQNQQIEIRNFTKLDEAKQWLG